MYKRKRIVIALGGNALGNTLPEQMQAVKTTAKARKETNPITAPNIQPSLTLIIPISSFCFK